MTQPAELRYLDVQTVADLLQLNTSKLKDGARAIVRTRYQNQPGNREYIFTRRAPDTITFVANIAEGANVLNSPQGGYWVATVQTGTLTLNGTTPVVISNVYCSSLGFSANAQVLLNRYVAGAAPGFVTALPADNSVSVVSTNAADVGELRWSILCGF